MHGRERRSNERREYVMCLSNYNAFMPNQLETMGRFTQSGCPQEMGQQSASTFQLF